MQPITAGTALAASFTISATRLFSAVVQFDPLLASGTYYLLIVPGTTIPTLATNIATLSPITSLIWVHTSGAAPPISFSFADYGPVFETGVLGSSWVVCASSTAPTSFTSVGTHLWLCGGSKS